MLLGVFAQRAKAAEAEGASVEQLTELLSRGRPRRGVFLGDLEEGYMEAGEVAGDIRQILPAGEIVQDFVRGYFDTLSKLNGHST